MKVIAKATYGHISTNYNNYKINLQITVLKFWTFVNYNLIVYFLRINLKFQPLKCSEFGNLA